MLFGLLLYSLTAGGYVYSISYWHEGNGILRYDYTCKKTEGRQIMEAVATIAIASAAAFLLGPAVGVGAEIALPFA